MTRTRRVLIALVLPVLLVAAGACKSDDDTAGDGGARPPTPVRWAAIGDSFSSGEGAPGATGKCGRSQTAVPALAREQLAAAVEIEEFVHVACTGGRIPQMRGQLQDASAQSDDPGGRFNLITISVGGNDVGFGPILKDCVGTDDILDRVNNGIVGCDLTEIELLARATGLLDDLLPLYEDLQDALEPGGALVVLGYPSVYSDPLLWPGNGCIGLSKPDAQILRRVAVAMDLSIRTAAELAGATYVPTIDEYEGHELCGPDDDWLHGVSLGITDRTFRPQGSFHPNAEGQRVEADLLGAALLDLYDAR